MIFFIECCCWKELDHKKEKKKRKKRIWSRLVFSSHHFFGTNVVLNAIVKNQKKRGNVIVSKIHYVMIQNHS